MTLISRYLPTVIVAWLSACWGPTCVATTLSEAAAALQPGQWVQVTTQNFNAATTDDGASFNVFYYTEDMTWDPVSRQLLFVGGGHASDAEFLRYGEQTNAWVRVKPSGSAWHSNFSHAYDQNAIIPSLGKFYFRQPAYDPSDRIEIYDIPTGTWSRSAAMPVRPGCCGGLEYFPELNGLVLAEGSAGLLLYEPAQNRWSTISSSVSMGEYHNFAEYSPVHKVMIFGGGEGTGGSTVQRLDANRQITRLRDAPQRLGQTHSIVTVDPNSGNFLVFFDNAFYEFQPLTDTWTRMNTSAPWSGGVFSVVATPISTYGVVLFAKAAGDSSRVWLYRHSPGSGTTVPSVTITASPTSVAAQGTSTLTWSSSDADSCTASGGWSGSRALSGSQLVGPLANTATFTLTCTNSSGGSTSRSATVQVASSVPAPTVGLSANPTSIPAGGSSTLSWTTSDATSCAASGGWSGSKSVPNGTQSVGPINASTTYTLSCTGAGGTNQQSVTVGLVAAPTLSFSAAPTSVTAGSRSTLTWSAQNASSCVASGAWAGSKTSSGSEQTAVLNASATFNLECTGAGGTVGRSVTVDVGSTPVPVMPTVSLAAAPTSIQSGGSTMLTWSSTNATTCAASGGWSGSKATSGAQQIDGLTQTSTFTLACTGAGGTAQANAQVTVGTASAPTVTISASPTTVASGTATTLNWSSSNASSCTASGGWNGAKGTSGSQQTAALAQNTSFTLECTGSGGTNQAQIMVQVTSDSNAVSTAQSGGGGSFGWLGLALGALLVGRRRRTNGLRHAPLGLLALALTLCGATQAADLATVTVVNSTSTAQSSVPVTFGHVFKPGDVPAAATVGGRIGSTALPLQVDKKATHSDGSLRHAVITAIVPTLAASGTQSITLTNEGGAAAGGAIALSALLATNFDATLQLNVGGTQYSASARTLLQQGTPATWLSGPNATEWLASGPVRTGDGTAHPHLQARFYVRAYEGLSSARVEVVLENNWALEQGPRNYSYDATINVTGRGGVFSETGVTHYSQSRWRRVVWWGTQPSYDVRHDSAYLMATRAVPTYDPRITISSSSINEWVSGFGTPRLMGIGDLEPYMPAPGGRPEIAPLPGFAASYIISQDVRVKRVTVGYGEQSGAWPMHYRDKATDLPLSIDTYPNATIVGGSSFFPSCGGSCSSPYTPEASHHPSLAYLPYLITGDYYLMEEMLFWGNYSLVYSPSDRRGGSQGLVAWDQIRGQAWNLRTLGQTAYATPDAHPMKQYFMQKVRNNIRYYTDTWVDSNPLGYVTNSGPTAWLGYPSTMATWMDDFLTWAFGYLVNLGFPEAQPVVAWKGKFPVGRLTDPDMCWVLASTYWPYVYRDRYLGGSATYVDNWRDWRYNIIYSWNNDAFRGTSNISNPSALFNAQCGSSQMASLLGLSVGEMIGWDGAEAYPANMQPATAVAVEAGVANAQQAFDRLISRPTYPLNDYGARPQWAVYPATATASLPAVSIAANPTAVVSGGSSTLTWSSTGATTCTASGGWAGNKALSGTQSVGPITTATQYTLSCSNDSGATVRSVSVGIQGATPTVTLSATPTNVQSGGSTTLNWSSTNATSCTASGGWSGSKATSGSQQISGVAQNTTFALSCSGAGGSAQQSVQVTVSSTPLPTVTLSAAPTSVQSGGSTALTWSSTNATSCTASGDWSGNKATSGTQQIAGLMQTATFTLSCTGAGGSAQQTVQVAVAGSTPMPSVTLAASPSTVASGGGTTITWSSTNAASCTASGGWSGSKATSGTQQITGLTQTTTFTLACTGVGGTAQQSTNVTVGASVPTVTIAASPTTVSSGGATTLTWSSANATSCTASGGWSGAKTASGTEQIGSLTQSTTFTLTCSGAGGDAQNQTQVVVSAAASEGDSGGGGGSMGWWSLLALLGLSGVRSRRCIEQVRA